MAARSLARSLAPSPVHRVSDVVARSNALPSRARLVRLAVSSGLWTMKISRLFLRVFLPRCWELGRGKSTFKTVMALAHTIPPLLRMLLHMARTVQLQLYVHANSQFRMFYLTISNGVRTLCVSYLDT